ncbi:unnamed protein product [marine sediment metagenome]|uniref:Transcription regulator TrmB N-terminal domain-containing protein n=1 Tax=marine sediment metagenome TaxID=412755 RepID=X1HF13_9ZZZZ
MSNTTGKTMLSQKELKAADALGHLDIPKIESRVLFYLFKKEGVTAREIEQSVDLRQPEVSKGTNALIDRKWIKASLIKKKGKGRPYYKFYMAKPKESIISDIQDGMQKRMEREKQDMQVIHELSGVKN